MEDEPLDNETALREEIAALREQISRTRQALGALETEVRRREGEFIAIRSARYVDDYE
ncbi:MAG TPA: hypothetical protein VIG24_05415 [Acidimicrobiia bacterium]